MRQLLLAITLCAGTGFAASNEVVVADHDLPAGTRVKHDDLSVRQAPRPWTSSSYVEPEKAAYIENQILIEPVAAGEPVGWGYFGVGAPSDVDAVCALVPRGRALPKGAYDDAASKSETVIVAAKDLEMGTVLTKELLATAKSPKGAEAKYLIAPSALPSLLGQKLLVPVQAGDPLRQPEVAGLSRERRCELFFDAAGNQHAHKGPPAADAVKCPAGTKRLAGIPAGEKWNPSLPGWAVTCVNGKGARFGPYVAFHRLTGQLIVNGMYVDNKRNGAWDVKDQRDGTHRVVTFNNGVPDGKASVTSGNVVRSSGTYAKGFRQGDWQFSSGDGKVKVSGSFKDGAPTQLTATDAKGNKLAEVQFSRSAKGMTLETGKAANDANKVPVLTAARDLRAGATLTEQDVAKTERVPRVIAESVLIDEEGEQFALSEALDDNVPNMAPLFWEDVDLIADQPDPVPPAP
ncbi:MAG: SAF domain-containing protein [Myxococcaceae bacterium]